MFDTTNFLIWINKNIENDDIISSNKPNKRTELTIKKLKKRNTATKLQTQKTTRAPFVVLL